MEKEVGSSGAASWRHAVENATSGRSLAQGGPTFDDAEGPQWVELSRSVSSRTQSRAPSAAVDHSIRYSTDAGETRITLSVRPWIVTLWPATRRISIGCTVVATSDDPRGGMTW